MGLSCAPAVLFVRSFCPVSTATSLDLSMLKMLAESTPLLPSKSRPTVPKLQLLFVCVWRAAQSVLFSVIFPFVNSMLVDLKIATPDNVGKYSSSLESTTALCNLLALFPAAWLGQRFGRRPLILSCVSAMCLAGGLFGLSRQYWQLMLMRCLLGVFSAQAVVARTMLGELSTPDTIGVIYAWSGTSWQIGTLIAPIFASLFTDPAINFPCFKHNTFLISYPYALPGIAASALIVPFILCAVFKMRETANKGRHTASDPLKHAEGQAAPPNLRNMLRHTPTLYGLLLWACTICAVNLRFAVLVLFLYSPVSLGGLGMSPAGIGAYSAIRATATLLVHSPTLTVRMRLLGRKGFLRAHALSLPLFLLLAPCLNLLVVAGTPMAAVYSLLGVLVALEVAFTGVIYAVDIIMVESLPSREYLTNLNACSETCAVLGVSIGTFLGGCLYASSAFVAWSSGLLLSLLLVVVCFRWQDVPSQFKTDDDHKSPINKA